MTDFIMIVENHQLLIISVVFFSNNVHFGFGHFDKNNGQLDQHGHFDGKITIILVHNNDNLGK